MTIHLNYFISLFLLFNIPEVSKTQNELKLSNNLAIVNPQPMQKSYTATAQFWGRLATGVKQPSTVTLYPNQENRLLVIIILSQKCGRFFDIEYQIIKKVTYSCSQEEKDESANYINWKIDHNSLAKEIRMISPPANNNPLYIRNEAFWLIKY